MMNIKFMIKSVKIIMKKPKKKMSILRYKQQLLKMKLFKMIIFIKKGPIILFS